MNKHTNISILINEEHKGTIYKVINHDATKFQLEDGRWILKSNCTVVDLSFKTI